MREDPCWPLTTTCVNLLGYIVTRVPRIVGVSSLKTAHGPENFLPNTMPELRQLLLEGYMIKKHFALIELI